MSIRRIVKTYDVSRITLRNRIENYILKTEERNVQHNLISIEEEILVRYILDLNSRGFSSRINDIRNIINFFRKIRHTKLVNK